ncbi:MAG: hypothetical protein ACRC2V_16975 [Xenococcaceae cyanobacterium]
MSLQIEMRRVFLIVAGLMLAFDSQFAVAGSLVRKLGIVVAKENLDGDGIEESFRSCASAEGLHLTVWSGQALTGTRKWHSYYYLGYDVEPTCTAIEIKDM